MTTDHAQHLDKHQLAAEVKNFARRLGFDLVGIAPADASQHRDYLRQWLDEGRAGTMEYLARRFDERTDPGRYLPGAASVICVGLNYNVPLDPVPESERRHHGKIARYALGDDYHELMKQKLWELADWLRETVPGAQTKTGVDTAPILERELAARAGIGWIGKNTCVINPWIGSWLLLGEILTTVELPLDSPESDRCGTCRRCIDACPTGAIDQPYQLDARRCISYLTIEHRERIPEQFHGPIGQWLYGCDICQEVCPWNSRAAFSLNPALQPRFPTGTLDTREALNWSPPQFNQALRGSAMKRVKLPLLQRNARIVATNAENASR